MFCLFAVALAEPASEKDLRWGRGGNCVTLMVHECYTIPPGKQECVDRPETFCWPPPGTGIRAVSEIDELFTSRRKVESAKRDEDECRTVYQKVCTNGQKGHECDMVPTTVCFSRVG